MTRCNHRLESFQTIKRCVQQWISLHNAHHDVTRNSVKKLFILLLSDPKHEILY